MVILHQDIDLVWVFSILDRLSSFDDFCHKFHIFELIRLGHWDVMSLQQVLRTGERIQEALIGLVDPSRKSLGDVLLVLGKM